MNGIISESASSSSVSKPKILTTIILGTCLFSGFVSGMTVSPASLARLNPFRTETLQYGKISWISAENSHDFKFVSETPAEEVVVGNTRASGDLSFVPFEFKPEKVKPYRFGYSKRNHANFLKLQKAVEAIKEATRYDAFEDYQMASSHLKNDFDLAMNGTPAKANEMIAMAASSADAAPEAKDPAILAAVPMAIVPTEELSPADRLALEAKKEAALSGNASYGSVEKPTITHRAHKAHVAAAPVVSEEITTTASSNEEPIRQNIDEVSVSKVNTHSVSIQTKQIPYAIQTTELPAQVVTSSQLSPEEQQKLTETLLAVQLSAKSVPQAVKIAKQEVPLSRTTIAEAASIPDSDPVAYDDSQDEAPRVNELSKTGSTACATLANHEFVRPNGPSHPTLDSQVCPVKATWISRSRSGNGWVKVEGDDYLPTLTLQPAPNQGPTLLIDQNALALIALKTGVHVTKGMGIILGVVPEGFKIDFNGRAEETEYFESSGKNYFAILNAEPGAGVVELESKTNPNLNSTVFTPVLEDTISYLDLSAPVARTLNIKVVKSGVANDPEVAKLTVGLSTQQGIQAITRADGQAQLKSVNLVPGFPVFVDVSSHTEENASYTYRYELKHIRKSGSYVVNEMTENTIHHWLRQVQQGLSDQSAMVVGMYDRKKLDGFKNPHFTQVNPLTAKFGLEPINYTVLWNGKLSTKDPLEGDVPRFMSVQVPEGLSQVNLLNESRQVVATELIPVSPRVIHVISE